MMPPLLAALANGSAHWLAKNFLLVTGRFSSSHSIIWQTGCHLIGSNE